MGGQQSAQRRLDINGIDFQPCQPNRDQVARNQKDAPTGSYARLAFHRPKLLPEVEDTLKQYRSGSKISGNVSGTKLPTYQLLKNHGVYYEGQWKNGLQNGRGIARGSNGTYIEAYFLNGRADGFGIHVYPDGSYYSGQFKNGQYNGRGKFFYKLNRMTYEGQWKDGKPNGKGKQDFPEIGYYEGNFLGGFKHGKGHMKWKDGRQYDGDFFEGYMHGQGVLKKKKGQYRGRFERNNKVSGRTVTQYGVYQGPYVRGQFSGRGKFAWNNGNVYQGEFKYNKMHGRGSMLLKNGQRFTGQWYNGINVKIDEK